MSCTYNRSERNYMWLRNYSTVVRFVCEHLKCWLTILPTLKNAVWFIFLLLRAWKWLKFLVKSEKLACEKTLQAMKWHRNGLELSKMATQILMIWNEIGNHQSLQQTFYNFIVIKWVSSSFKKCSLWNCEQIHYWKLCSLLVFKIYVLLESKQNPPVLV